MLKNIPLQRNILFLTLSTFSSTGGIEKFNRAFLLALSQVANGKANVNGWGLYDTNVNEQYIDEKHYRFFNGNRIWFVINAIIASLKKDVLVIGHINLAVIGVVAKILKPSLQLLVVCHGIEVFSVVKGWKQKLLQKATLLLAVSSFTKQKLCDVQQIPAQKITIFHNTIDPFFKMPSHFEKPDYLKKRYQIADDEKVLLTITRLNSKEGYKGYDTIINTLPTILKTRLKVKYLLCGKADPTEQERIRKQIQKLGLEKHVIVAGFIPDCELTDHYLLADLFVMPSKGEGFGIVFLEAMACGLPVIAGNKDGSVDALQNGELGTLVDPEDEATLCRALIKNLSQKTDALLVQQKMVHYFSFEHYVYKLSSIAKLHSLEAA